MSKQIFTADNKRLELEVSEMDGGIHIYMSDRKDMRLSIILNQAQSRQLAYGIISATDNEFPPKEST